MRGRVRAYHRHPSVQRVVILELSTIVRFEDKLVVKLGEGDAGVGVEFFGVQGKGLRGGGFVHGSRVNL